MENIMNDGGLANLAKIFKSRMDIIDIQDYRQDTMYEVGNKVRYNNDIYTTITSHDGEVFDPTHNTLYIQSYDYKEYSEYMSYSVGNIVIYRNSIYRTIVDHTSEVFDLSHNELIFTMPGISIGLFKYIYDTTDISFIGIETKDIPISSTVIVFGELSVGTVMYDKNFGTYLVTKVIPSSTIDVTCINRGLNNIKTIATSSPTEFNMPYDGIKVIRGGQNYVLGDHFALSNGFTGMITSIDANGGITSVYHDYSLFPTTNIYDGDMIAINTNDTQSTQGSGAYISIRTVRNYGDNDVIGTLQQTHGGDPIVHLSKLESYVYNQISNLPSGGDSGGGGGDSGDSYNDIGVDIGGIDLCSPDDSLLIVRNGNKIEFVVITEDTMMELTFIINMDFSEGDTDSNMFMHIRKITDGTYSEYQIQKDVGKKVMLNLHSKYSIGIYDRNYSSTVPLGSQIYEYITYPQGSLVDPYTVMQPSTMNRIVNLSFHLFEGNMSPHWSGKNSTNYGNKSTFISTPNHCVDIRSHTSPNISSTEYPYLVGLGNRYNYVVARYKYGDDIKVTIFNGRNGGIVTEHSLQVDSHDEFLDMLTNHTIINGWAYSIHPYSIVVNPIDKRILVLSYSGNVIVENVYELPAVDGTIKGVLVFDEYAINSRVILGFVSDNRTIYFYYLSNAGITYINTFDISARPHVHTHKYVGICIGVAHENSVQFRFIMGTRPINLIIRVATNEITVQHEANSDIAYTSYAGTSSVVKSNDLARNSLFMYQYRNDRTAITSKTMRYDNGAHGDSGSATVGIKSIMDFKWTKVTNDNCFYTCPYLGISGDGLDIVAVNGNPYVVYHVWNNKLYSFLYSDIGVSSIIAVINGNFSNPSPKYLAPITVTGGWIIIDSTTRYIQSTFPTDIDVNLSITNLIARPIKNDLKLGSDTYIDSILNTTSTDDLYIFFYTPSSGTMYWFLRKPFDTGTVHIRNKVDFPYPTTSTNTKQFIVDNMLIDTISTSQMKLTNVESMDTVDLYIPNDIMNKGAYIEGSSTFPDSGDDIFYFAPSDSSGKFLKWQRNGDTIVATNTFGAWSSYSAFCDMFATFNKNILIHDGNGNWYRYDPIADLLSEPIQAFSGAYKVHHIALYHQYVIVDKTSIKFADANFNIVGLPINFETYSSMYDTIPIRITVEVSPNKNIIDNQVDLRIYILFQKYTVVEVDYGTKTIKYNKIVSGNNNAINDMDYLSELTPYGAVVYRNTELIVYYMDIVNRVAVQMQIQIQGSSNDTSSYLKATRDGKIINFRPGLTGMGVYNLTHPSESNSFPYVDDYTLTASNGDEIFRRSDIQAEDMACTHLLRTVPFSNRSNIFTGISVNESNDRVYRYHGDNEPVLLNANNVTFGFIYGQNTGTYDYPYMACMLEQSINFIKFELSQNDPSVISRTPYTVIGDPIDGIAVVGRYDYPVTQSIGGQYLGFACLHDNTSVSTIIIPSNLNDPSPNLYHNIFTLPPELQYIIQSEFQGQMVYTSTGILVMVDTYRRFQMYKTPMMTNSGSMDPVSVPYRSNVSIRHLLGEHSGNICKMIADNIGNIYLITNTFGIFRMYIDPNNPLADIKVLAIGIDDNNDPHPTINTIESLSSQVNGYYTTFDRPNSRWNLIIRNSLGNQKFLSIPTTEYKNAQLYDTSKLIADQDSIPIEYRGIYGGADNMIQVGQNALKNINPAVYYNEVYNSFSKYTHSKVLNYRL